MIKLINKKADERYLSVWMLINWIVIGVCLVVGAIIFLSVLADARLAEAQILADRLNNCLSSDFSFQEFNSKSFDIYAKCGLNKVPLENSELYYFNITLQESASGKAISKLIKGRGTFEVFCRYQNSGGRQENFPKCVTRVGDIYDKQSGTKYYIDILTASNQN